MISVWFWPVLVSFRFDRADLWPRLRFRSARLDICSAWFLFVLVWACAGFVAVVFGFGLVSVEVGLGTSSVQVAIGSTRFGFGVVSVHVGLVSF